MPVEGNRYFNYNGQDITIPISSADKFLKDYPDAQEVGLFNIGGADPAVIPFSQLPKFIGENPTVKPFYDVDTPYYANIIGNNARSTYGGLMDLAKQGAQISTEEQAKKQAEPKPLEVTMPGGIGYNMEDNYAGQTPGDVTQGLKAGFKQTGSAILQGADYVARMATESNPAIPGYGAAERATREVFASLSEDQTKPEEERKMWNELATKPTTILGDWANSLNKSGAEDIQQAPNPNVAQSFAMLPQMLPIAAAMVVPGAQGAIMPVFGLMGSGSGIQQYHQYLDESIKQGKPSTGYDPEVELGLAVLFAAIETGTEQLGSVSRFVKGKYMTKAAQTLAAKEILETTGEKGAKEIFQKFLSQHPTIAKTVYNKYLLQPGEEAFEEVVAQVSEYGLQAGLYDKDASWKELGTQTWQAALGGFVMGGLLTGYGRALTSYRIDKARESNQTLNYGIKKDGTVFEVIGRNGDNYTVVKSDGDFGNEPASDFEKVVSLDPKEASILKSAYEAGESITAQAEQAAQAPQQPIQGQLTGAEPQAPVTPQQDPIQALSDKITPVLNDNGTHLITNLHADGKPYFIKSGVTLNAEGKPDLDNIDPSQPPIILDENGKVSTVPFTDFDPTTWEAQPAEQLLAEQAQQIEQQNIILAQQQSIVEAQQPSSNPEQLTVQPSDNNVQLNNYPLDKDGNVDTKQMDDTQKLNYLKDTFGEEKATTYLNNIIKTVTDKIAKAEKKQENISDLDEAIKIEHEIKKLTEQKAKLEGLITNFVPVTSTANSNISDVRSDASHSTPNDNESKDSKGNEGGIAISGNAPTIDNTATVEPAVAENATSEFEKKVDERIERTTKHIIDQPNLDQIKNDPNSDEYAVFDAKKKYSESVLSAISSLETIRENLNKKGTITPEIENRINNKKQEYVESLKQIGVEYYELEVGSKYDFNKVAVSLNISRNPSDGDYIISLIDGGTIDTDTGIVTYPAKVIVGSNDPSKNYTEQELNDIDKVNREEKKRRDQERDQHLQESLGNTPTGTNEPTGVQSVPDKVQGEVPTLAPRVIKPVINKLLPGKAGEVAVSKYNNSPKIEGREKIITLPNNERIAGKYMLVESGTVTPSHNPLNFSQNEGFPTTPDGKTVNDRDYGSDKAAQAQVIDIANQYNGKALDNPVIVSPDGIVVSGNNRTMSGELAAGNGTDASYVEQLMQDADMYGFTPEQVSSFKNPRVIFQMNETPEYTTETFAKFNASDQKTQNKVERAIKISKTIKPEQVRKIARVLDRFDTMSDAYASTSATNELIDLMVDSGIITTMDIAEILDGKTFSAIGKDMIETVLIGSVMDESSIRMMNIEGMKQYRLRITKSILPLLENQALGEYSILPEMNGAVVLLGKMRSGEFGSVYDMVSLPDMFDTTPYNLTEVLLADVLTGNQTDTKSFFNSYNEIATANKNGQLGLFNDKVQTKEEILDEIENNAVGQRKSTLNKARTFNAQLSDGGTVNEAPKVNTGSAGSKQKKVAEPKVKAEKPKFAGDAIKQVIKQNDDIDNALNDLLGLLGEEDNTILKHSNGPSDKTPEQLSKINAAGFKLVDAFTKQGVYKFADIISGIESKGVPISPELLSACKKGYASFLLENEDARLDDFTAVRAYTYKINSPKEDKNSDLGRNFDKNNNDVPDRPGSSQPDSGNSANEVPENGTPVLSGRGSSEPVRNETPAGSGKAVRRNRSEGGGGLFANLPGEQGDNEVYQADPKPIVTNNDAGDFDGRGSSIDSPEGHNVNDIVTGKPDGTNNEGLPETFQQRTAKRLIQQQQNESIPVKLMDEANIRQTLPYLLDEQQDDVLKAETRFFSEAHKTKDLANGKGILFTNGTGTGKTFTGLGIIKRFAKQGKGQILIVVPSEPKIKDWIKDGINLGLDITNLEDTKTAGKGINICTYANFRSNDALKNRDLDLIVYDESHRLMEEKKGTASATTYAHFGLSNVSVSTAFQRITDVHPVWIKHREAMTQYRELNASLNNDNAANPAASEAAVKVLSKVIDDLEAKKKELEPALLERAKRAYENTKVVFLSATPFKGHFNLRYANRVLFDYTGEEITNARGSRVDAESRFFLENFGSAYQWKHHQLETKEHSNPEAIAMQEVEFAQKLMSQGVMSGRAIESDMDYSREFPLVALDNAELFNNGLNDIFNYETKEFEGLQSAARDVFYDYNYTTQLFESLKASMVIPRIEKHLALGRKVVVFHRRKQANVSPPFKTIIDRTVSMANEVLNDTNSSAENKEKARLALSQANNFEDKYADLLAYEQTLNYNPAIEQIQAAFGTDRVALINGDVSKANKPANIAKFNKDGSGVDIIVVQEEAGKEGISLHDTSGKNQRVLMSLSMPISSTTALQIEGRIFRIGQESNAIFENPLLGLDMEIENFGRNVNKKLSTTENLAVGDQARDLLRSFAEGVLWNSKTDDPNLEQGKGGKEYDKKAQQQLSEFRRAVLVYNTLQKTTGLRDQREGTDYYATPEPVGQKMVEWLGLQFEESALEPSAGHGAIAMWFPEYATVTAVEPSHALFSKLNARSGGGTRKIINDTFENLNIVNKFHGIAMNPPFGSGGKTAMDHVAKAFTHLKNGGRIVALIPEGKMSDRLDTFLYGTDENGKQINPDAHLVASIKLPSVTFKQAGTSVSTRIVVIDKYEHKSERQFANELGAENGRNYLAGKPILSTDEIQAEASRRFNEQNSKYSYPENLDYSHIEKIEDLFDALEDVTVNERLNVGESQPQQPSITPSNDNVIKIDAPYTLETVKHTQTGADLYMVKLGDRIASDEYAIIKDHAKSFGGFWDKWSKGFRFPDLESRQKFVDKAFAFPDENSIMKHSNSEFAGDHLKRISETQDVSERQKVYLQGQINSSFSIEQTDFTNLPLPERHSLINTEAKSILSELQNKTPLLVVQSEKDVRNWYFDNKASSGHMKEIEDALLDKSADAFFDGTYRHIVVIASRVPSMESIRPTIIHETVHAHNRAFLSARRSQILQYFHDLKGYESIDGMLNKSYDDYTEYDRADEALAYTIQGMIVNGVIPTEEPLTYKQIMDVVEGKEIIDNFERRFISTLYYGTNRKVLYNKPIGDSHSNLSNTGADSGESQTSQGEAGNDSMGTVLSSSQDRPRFAGELLGEGSVNLLKHSSNNNIPPSVNPTVDAERPQFAGMQMKRIIGKKDYGDRFADWIAENVHSVDLWQQEMAKDGIKGLKLFDVYSLLRRRKGLIKGLVDTFDEGVFTDLQTEIAHLIDQQHVSSKEIQRYLKAKSAIERNDNEGIRAISEDPEDSWNRQTVEQIVKEFEQKISPNLIDSLWSKVKASTDFTIDNLYLHSVITKEDHDKFNDRKYYIPLRGWEYDEMNPNPEDFYDYVNNEGQGITSQTYVKATIKAKGRTSEPGDPLPYIRQMAHSAIMTSVKNKIARTALQLFRMNKDNPAMGQYMYIKAPFKGNAHEAKRTRATAEKHEIMGYDNGDRFTLVLGDPHVAQSIKGENVLLKETSKWLGNSWMGKLTQFMKANFTGKNPNFFLNNFMFIDLPYAAITEGIRKEGEAGQFIRQIVTGKSFGTIHRDIRKQLNPLSQAETITAGLHNKQSIVSAIQQYGEQRVLDTLYKMWKDSGGPTGWMQLESFEKSAEKIEKEINRIRAKEADFGKGTGKLSGKDKVFYNYPLRKGAELMTYVMDMSEQSSRFAVFVSRKMAGQSSEQAALASKEATVDFDRTGQASTVFNQLFAFFKPTVSATYGIYKMGKENKAKFGYALGSFFALGVLQAILAYMTMPDDEGGENTYDNIPDYDKLNNLIINRGDGKYVKIPLPQFFRAIYALGVTSTMAAMGKLSAGEFAASNLKNLTGALTPFNVSGDDLGRTLVPTALTPAYDIAVNQNFAGKKVHKEQFTTKLEDRIPGSQEGLNSTFEPLVQATQWLNEFGGGNEYTKAGQGLDPETGLKEDNTLKTMLFDWNPADIQHVSETVGGGRVKFFRQVFNTAYNAVTPDGKMNEWDVPLFYRYLGRSQDSNPMSTYYNALKAVDEYKYQINNLKKDDPKEALQMMNKYQFMNELTYITKLADKNIKNIENNAENATSSEAMLKYKTDAENAAKIFKTQVGTLEKKYKINLK